MDAEGYVTVRGRSKNMLLTSSGQNIYPEEIESKLNNMPYVSESLIVLQKEKLVALIYPDFDDAFANGLQQTDVERMMEANRNELNQQLPAYCQISKIKIHFEEFEKTEYAPRLRSTGVVLSYICPLMYMNNPLSKAMPVITSSNKLRTYTTARYYTEDEIITMITKGAN